MICTDTLKFVNDLYERNIVVLSQLLQTIWIQAQYVVASKIGSSFVIICCNIPISKLIAFFVETSCTSGRSFRGKELPIVVGSDLLGTRYLFSEAHLQDPKKSERISDTPRSRTAWSFVPQSKYSWGLLFLIGPIYRSTDGRIELFISLFVCEEIFPDEFVARCG